ncbi:hypothetical protein CCR75_002918 [Bremia lactucae]|uniref:Bzip transcription factor n=1 Tax=Bremia lactucae TaxID=4779 RepID=A0A976FQ36_BRELC|nr:hypothetical protein CCR75_002918 [Bremia lactucae]
MSRYPFAPRPVDDNLMSLMYQQKLAHHLHTKAYWPTTPFLASKGPKDASDKLSFLDKQGDFRVRTLNLLNLSNSATDCSTQPCAEASTYSPVDRRQINNVSETLKIYERLCEKAHKIRRREQCRTNQARYRDKQRNAEQQLKRSAEQLQEEMTMLRRRYRVLASLEKSNQSSWNTVSEVFRLFDTTFRYPWCMTSTHEMIHHAEARTILGILKGSFAQDAAMGELRGVPTLLEHLLWFSQSFGSPRVQLQRIERVTSDIMAARARINLTITEITLQHVFFQKEETVKEATHEIKRELLYERLLGQRLECDCSFHFLFDDDSDRVVRLEATIDLTTPLFRVLGSLKDVATILFHSRRVSMGLF